MADAPRLFVVLYTDEDITNELAPALRERGFEAQSALEAGLLNTEDDVQLAYAAERGMTLITCNAGDYLKLARQYAEADRPHFGIVISSEQFSRRRFGELLKLTLRLMNSLSADDLQNCVVYLQQFR